MDRNSLLKGVCVLAMALLAASCSGVTETGNPCPMGVCPPVQGDDGGGADSPSMESQPLYSAADYALSIAAVTGWSLAEADAGQGSGASAWLSYGTPATSWALVKAERLAAPPVSLLNYLQETYPTRDFTAVSATHVDGLLYDSQTAWGSDGDYRLYYFLNGSVLVTIEAYIAAGELSAMTALLNAVTM